MSSAPSGRRGGDLPKSDRLHTITLDLGDKAAIGKAVEDAFAIRGRVDVIVNNAGFPLFGAVEEPEDDQIEQLYEVNVNGPRRLIQAALPRLREQGSGYIINITSVGGYVPLSGYGYYASTKAAMESLTEVLAEEVAPFGIRVTAVAPGAFRTEFITKKSVQDGKEILGYDQTRANIQKFWDSSGKQPGDPDKLAQVLLKLADNPHPPSRLLLGSDALQRTRNHTDKLVAQIDANEELSRSTDYD